MEKFEALLGDKKSKKDEKKPDSEKLVKEETFGLEEATQLKKEIGEITQGRSLENLEISDLKQVFNKYKKMENVLGVAEKEKEGLSGEIFEQIKNAKEILGKQDVMGPEEVKKAFGIEINLEDIPKIPFEKAELERAKELNQFLVLRVDKAPDGEPLSMQKINEILKGKVSDGSKLLSSDDGKGGIKDDYWYRNEAFFKKETPKLAWSLASKEVIPNSTSKNYLQQTEELVNYIKDSVFKEEVPEEYQEAIKEFEKEKDGVGKIITSEWERGVEKWSNLKINRLTRQNSAEVLYDIAIYFQNKGERILENQYSWTRSWAHGCDSDGDGGCASVGWFNEDGVSVDGLKLSYFSNDLGVIFSRSC